MTHVMVPDGVLAPWLWIGTWVLAAAGLAWSLWATRESDRVRMVPLAAVMAAVMTIVMSLEIVPLGYEPHFTVLSGIVLGPAYGFLASFVFNILRMLLGDGAVTLLGLNTVLLGTEAVLGYYAFRALSQLRLPVSRPTAAGVAAALATVVALGVATLLFLAAVSFGSTDISGLAELAEERGVAEGAGFAAFATAVLTLGAIGWILEGLVVGAIVAFVRTVRPSLIPLPPSRRPSSLATEGGGVSVT